MAHLPTNHHDVSECTPRTRASYLEDLEDIGYAEDEDDAEAVQVVKTKHGINEACPFLGFPDFDPIRDIVYDVMHVELEGVLKHFLQTLIVHLVEKKICSLDYMNEIIRGTNWSASDKR